MNTTSTLITMFASLSQLIILTEVMIDTFVCPSPQTTNLETKELSGCKAEIQINYDLTI